MPRVNSLTTSGKVQDQLFRLTREVAHQLKDAGVSYTKVARYLDKTPAAISRQFAKGNTITLEVYLASQMLIEESLKG